MDLKRIGNFLKELRKEKGITQEMLAERLNVSGRTVSRWETGNNMPDISLLIELAEFYDVSISEIVNGERKNEKMNEEVKEVAQTLSNYADVEKENLIKKIRKESIVGVVAMLLYCSLEFGGLSEKYIWLGYMSAYCLTLAVITPLMIFLYTTGLIEKFKKTKKAQKTPKMTVVLIACALAMGVAFAANKILALFGI